MVQLEFGGLVGVAEVMQPRQTTAVGAEEGQSNDRRPGQRAPPGPMKREGQCGFANGEDQSFGLCQACIVQVPTFLDRLNLPCKLFGRSSTGESWTLKMLQQRFGGWHQQGMVSGAQVIGELPRGSGLVIDVLC